MFDNCPYEGGYDLKIADTNNRKIKKTKYIPFVDFSKYNQFKHALIFFGGLQGINGLLDDTEEALAED